MTARAVAVVVRGHKVLVVPARGGGYAELPGVAVEPGESPEDAVLRELADGWSLDGTVVRRLFEHDHGGDLTSYVLVEAPSGEPEARGQQPVWATAAELQPLGLRPEGIGELLTEAVWPVRVEVAGPDEWPVIERLWQLYQHDLSEFRHSAPGPDGLFPAGRLSGYVGDDNAAGYLARLGDTPCGFALVRGPAREERLMGEFFVTRAARRRGVATAFAREVIGRHPGPWVIPFQNENPRAAAFWRRLTAEILVDVRETPRPVPGKPHLPPDVWLTGSTR